MTEISKEIENYYKNGMSKEGIIILIYYKQRADDKKFSRTDARKLVEQSILDYYNKTYK